MKIPDGLTMDEGRALALGLDPWWDTMLAQLPMWCPTCHRAVFPRATEATNVYGLAEQVAVTWVQRGPGPPWCVIACCDRILAEGRRLSA